MIRTTPIVSALSAVTLVSTTTVHAQWLDLVEESWRIDAPVDLVAGDSAEKDYAWGDVDRDGDVDLVIVRKEPYLGTGRRTNVLLLNEDGILTDRTSTYAIDSDVGGDFGFLTPTNDRDVVIVDVNGDSWLDVVTSPTLTDNAAKHLSHPRVYINKGENAGAWQGFRFENARIPQMHPTAGPRFCSVTAGDVTGDGAPDLYFSDYDDGPPQIFDFNDRLFVNNGTGYFADQTTARLTPEMYTSAWGITSKIADMNDDGVADIVRLTACLPPYHVGISYNDPANEGIFNDYEMIYTLSAYEFGVGELNGDGRLDIVIMDDGRDRVMLNQGNDAQGRADFIQYLLPPQTNVFFAGNIVIEDLDQDGWNDVILGDVDTEEIGCDLRTFIFHNQGNPPAVTFAEEDQVIPEDMLRGVHDIAAIDINGDGWLDLVIGRCATTEVWINRPPAGLAFSQPNGTPEMVSPDTENVFVIEVTTFGGATLASGTVMQHVSVDGGSFVASAMADLAGGRYEARLPAVACPSDLRFWFSAQTSTGGVFVDPPTTPVETYRALVASGVEIALRDEIEGNVSGWTVENVGLSAGAWGQADPNGTVVPGALAAPDNDATAGAGVLAFVTENGPPGGSATGNDVDGGPTRLVSPVIDLDGANATISYARWFFCDDAGTPAADELTVEVSNDDGQTWIPLDDHTTAGTGGVWETDTFLVSDYVAPTAEVRVRFSTADQPNDSVTEAGIDDFEVGVLVCTSCVEDLTGDGGVGFADLTQLLSAWGPCSCPEDLNGDGSVGFADLTQLLSAWGPCG